MKNLLTASIVTAALLDAFQSAHAAPPTVTPSPGYDARLQESRKAANGVALTPAPANPPAVVHRHRKRKHAN